MVNRREFIGLGAAASVCSGCCGFGKDSGLRDGLNGESAREVTLSERSALGSFVFAQWNIGGSRLGLGKAPAEKNLAEIKRQVNGLNADFIGLCECSPGLKMRGTMVAEDIFGESRHIISGPNLGTNGNAIISRNARLSGAQVMFFPRLKQRRYFVACETEIGGQKTVLVQAQLDPDEKCRKSQLDELMQRFGSLMNVIVSADFSQTRMHEFAPFVRDGFKLANGGDCDMAITHHRQKTDRISVSDNVLVKGFDIISVHTADDSKILNGHRILVCRFAPSKNTAA